VERRGTRLWSVPILLALASCASANQDRSALLHADPTVCPEISVDVGRNVRVLACRQAWIGGMAADAEHLYFVAGDTLDAPYANTLKRLPLAGGPVQTLATFGALHRLPDDTTAENGGWLAVNRTLVVWSVPSTGQILSVPLAGGEPMELASDQDVPLRLALNETHVYWTNWSSCGVCSKGSVQSVALSGGEPVTIASKQDHPNGITIDAVNVYWVTAGGNVMQAPLIGGQAIALASGLMNPFFVTVDATTVYWTLPKAVMSCPILGCNKRPTQIASGLQAPNVVVGDATALYFSDWDAGSVHKLIKGHREPMLIAKGLEHPDVVVVSGQQVLWYTAGAEGVIMSAPIGQ
jgi:hypothetical protein